MQSHHTTVLDNPGSRNEDAFQKLLLQLSDSAATAVDLPSLIKFFCRAAREFFNVQGVYFWRSVSAEELIGAEADGLMADTFSGRRLITSESAVATEAVRQRKSLYVSYVDPKRYTTAAEFGAKSLMGVPLLVSNEAIGSLVFLSTSHPDFFNDDLAAKATILAGQLGSLLEAHRLTQVSREEHRRAEILMEVAQALHSVPDRSAVAEALADRLRTLLRARLVSILVRQDTGFNLHVVSGDSPQLSASARSRHDRRGMQFAADLAARAVTNGELLSFNIEPSSHALGDLVPGGMLLAAPFRTSRSQGAVLIYPRSDGPYNAAEKSLVSAIVGFGAVAMANAELYTTAREQSHELHQLLEISSELGALGDLDSFLRQFVVRATDFLGFGRGFVALLESGSFCIRWKCSAGASALTDAVFPNGIASRALLNKEEFYSDNVAEVAGVDLASIVKYDVRQILAVPLIGVDGQVLGMFGVLDKLQTGKLSSEDVRRARALAAPVSVALELTRNLHVSQEHRKRAESLMELARELNSQVLLPEFARSFVGRVAQMLDAESAALLLRQDTGWEIIQLQRFEGESASDTSLAHQFEQAIETALSQITAGNSIASGPTSELLGAALGSALGWSDCILMKLQSASGELIGALCVANRGRIPATEEVPYLEAIASHVSTALENARLFTRMDRANRHWIEIFDAISDFIIAHDRTDKVLRVNRSLADFIGVEPSALIGISMSALLASRPDSLTPLCPFCRSNPTDPADEYVHPVLDRTYLVSTSRVHGADHEDIQTVHVLKDITDRREAERRYRELFDNIQEGLFFSTPDGRFVEVNDALVRMLGYSSREDLLQASIPDQVYFAEDPYRELTRSMQQHGLVRNYEQTLRRKDGTPVHVLINAFAVNDAQQRKVQYRGLILDITGLKGFQSELQRERDFSSKILNNTQSLILVADKAGLISYANRRWQEMGYEQSQVLGRPLLDLVAGPRQEALSEAFTSTLAGNQVDNFDLLVLRSNGRTGQFSVNMSPMRDDQGNVTSVVVVMSDITDAATLQAKLMHAEKMAAVGQLVSGVAHEVNNPLTAILGFADLLMENPEMPESSRKDLRVILQEAQRTKQIVQNLLSFARQMPPQRKPVQLNGILRRTVQLRAYDFHSRGVEVIERFEPELPAIVGDPHQLQQVFLNIINNAYDAVRDTGRPARIEISTSAQGKSVEVVFRDNGQGISFPERIFDPFFTTKEIGKGTGLGLSICYGIVHEHGGEILCRNNADGKGATFIVRLPAASEPASIGAVAGVIQP